MQQSASWFFVICPQLYYKWISDGMNTIHVRIQANTFDPFPCLNLSVTRIKKDFITYELNHLLSNQTEARLATDGAPMKLHNMLLIPEYMNI